MAFPLIPLIIAGGSALASMGSSFFQQGWSQSHSASEAQKNRDFTENQAQLDREFNATQAQIQRDWSEKMASTAYQRTVSDMKAAGVNPALAFGGASNVSSGMAASHSTNAGPGTPSAAAPSVRFDLSSAFSSATMATLKNESEEFSKQLKNSIALMEKQKEAQQSNAAEAARNIVKAQRQALIDEYYRR